MKQVGIILGLFLSVSGFSYAVMDDKELPEDQAVELEAADE